MACRRQTAHRSEATRVHVPRDTHVNLTCRRWHGSITVHVHTCVHTCACTRERDDRMHLTRFSRTHKGREIWRERERERERSRVSCGTPSTPLARANPHNGYGHLHSFSQKNQSRWPALPPRLVSPRDRHIWPVLGPHVHVFARTRVNVN